MPEEELDKNDLPEAELERMKRVQIEGIEKEIERLAGYLLEKAKAISAEPMNNDYEKTQLLYQAGDVKNDLVKYVRALKGMVMAIKTENKAEEPVYGLIYGNKTGNSYSLQVRIPKNVRDRLDINEETPLLVRVDESRKRVILEVISDEETLKRYSPFIKAKR